ncbi:MAG TPA: hypothetical protein DEO84_06330 [candidate division Zixibacteria bacterium]|nr:hypothetical protein [candidate division Zixibacteria bacterium]
MRNSILIAAASIACVCLIIGCSDKGENVISGNGVITYISLEGCWGIMMDDGMHYTVYNLPESFRHEGLRVRITANRIEPAAFYCQVGPFIEIIDIRLI